MTKVKRINAAAVTYKSYLLQGVAPYLNERGGLAVASVLQPVTDDLKAQLMRDKEVLLPFLRAGHTSRQILLTFSHCQQKTVAEALAERLAIVTENGKTTNKEIALAWASAVYFFTKWQKFCAGKKSAVNHHKRKNGPRALINTAIVKDLQKSTLYRV